MVNITHKMNPLRPAVFDRLDRDPSLYGSLWVVVACLIVLATLLLPGCSNYSSAQPVDVPQARDALKTALDAWKKGEATQSLASSSMPMTVQDFEWDGGAKLIDYQLMDDGKAEDANLRIAVKLTMTGGLATGKSQNTSGKTMEKKASYVVGTSPRLTVFRDMMRR
jgi:hypothetical protein